MNSPNSRILRSEIANIRGNSAYIYRMPILFFLVVISCSAITAIYLRQTGNLRIFAVFKVLTTALIIVLSVLSNSQSADSYGWIITLGLIFSLVGDALILKTSLFVYALGSFLVAHILFAYAFSTLLGFQTNPYVLIGLVLICALYYRVLYSALKSLAIPVATYMLVIIIMDWQAISLALGQKGEVFLLIGIGAALFSLSDALLAFKKFKRDVKYAEVFILSTYWLAILLFCMSSSFA